MTRIISGPRRKRPGRLGRGIPLVVDHLEGAIQFLLGDEQRRIDGERLLELGDGIVKLARFTQLLAVVDNGGGGLETDAFEGGPVAQVFGLEIVSLLEEVVSLFVVLAGLGILTFVVKILGFVGEGGEG